MQEYFEDELKLSTSRNAVEKKRHGGKNSRTLPHQCIYVSQLKRRRITKKWGKPYSLYYAMYVVTIVRYQVILDTEIAELIKLERKINTFLFIWFCTCTVQAAS